MSQEKLAVVNSVGATGSKAITGTSAVTPATGYYFFCIVPVTDIVVSAKADVTGALNADLTAFTTGIPAGLAVYGKFTSITLTSGSAIGYYARV